MVNTLGGRIWFHCASIDRALFQTYHYIVDLCNKRSKEASGRSSSGSGDVVKKEGRKEVKNKES